MKIAFESQLFIKGNKTGIAWCADNIIKVLAKYEVCQCNFFSMCYGKNSIKKIEDYKQYGVLMNSCRWFNDILYKFIWPFIPLPYHWFFGNESDITQFFNCVIPPGVKGKKVVIVHDMAYKVCPETVRHKTKNWLRLTLKNSCRRADAIVTVSESSKKDIIKFLGVKADKITVMPNGVDLTCFKCDLSSVNLQRVKDKYRLKKSYFLYLGTLEPRKNIERIIGAYKLLNDQYATIDTEIPQLVIAGGKGWLYDTVFEKVQMSGLVEKIIFPGYVEQNEIPLLMGGARAFIFPSLYEGFGMPLLEAMACGTPVITSNVSSLPEVAGDAAFFVNPYKEEEICNAMHQIMTDNKLYEQLRAKGIVRAQKYTWEKSAAILHELYQRLLANKDEI